MAIFVQGFVYDALTTTSDEETLLKDFLVILKRMLQELIDLYSMFKLFMQGYQKKLKHISE